MSFIALVRHGESTWNAEHRLQGQMDPPLSDLGREQARASAEMVAALGVAPERVICSDLTRTRETAAGLALQPARFDPSWREIDIGEWGGKLAAEVDDDAQALTNWRGGPRTAPSGETWEAFSARVAAAFDLLVEAGGPWLVVTHGGCIRAACAHVTGGDALAFGAPLNASLTKLELAASGPRLVAYGVTAAGAARSGIY